MKKKIIVHIDMDDTLANYSQAHKEALAKNPKVGYPQSQYGFYTKLAPLQGAFEALAYLRDSEVFEPYIATAPSFMNPMSYTEKRVWIEEHGGEYYIERFAITPNKGLLKGDILIDDLDCGRGQELFEGTLFHFGTEGFSNWDEVMLALKQVEKDALGGD